MPTVGRVDAYAAKVSTVMVSIVPAIVASTRLGRMADVLDYLMKNLILSPDATSSVIVTVMKVMNFWKMFKCVAGWVISTESLKSKIWVSEKKNNLNNFRLMSKLCPHIVPCDVEFNCHWNATCEWYELELRHMCTCKSGYYGDGYNCAIIDESCAVVSK